jgi:3'(2'), 5'-bisphosphate nucleotidase
VTSAISDDVLAARVAREAGLALMRLRENASLEGTGALGETGDRLSHAHLVSSLRTARPDDAILSEEGAEGPARTSRERVWIIDPLDGTREYAEGRADFAVHVALVVDGQPVAGTVALPAEGVVFSAVDPVPMTGASRHQGSGQLRIAVSRSRPPAEATEVADRLGAELVPMGSAGVKTIAVVRGDVDAYLHAGGQYEWDSAAPVAVARSHGAYAARLDGSRLVYNQPDPWLPDLLICRPELAEKIVAALRP